MSKERYMLLDEHRVVVAEVTHPCAKLECLKNGALRWRDRTYLYDNRYDNGEYQFYIRIPEPMALTDSDLEIR